MTKNEQIKIFMKYKGYCYNILCLSDSCIFNLKTSLHRFCGSGIKKEKQRYDYVLNYYKIELLEKYI